MLWCYLQVKDIGVAWELTDLGLQRMVREPGVGFCCLETEVVVK